MITVFQAVNDYCTFNAMPQTPSHHDYKNCGNIISTHFRRHWGISRPEAVAEVRYVIEETPFRKLVVISYPESFKGEMLRFINEYYLQKAEKIRAHLAKVEEKKAALLVKKDKKRTRKPIPAYTTKK